MIIANISDLSKKINITIIDSNGNEVNFTNLQEFQEYYDTYIGKIIDNKISANNTNVIDTQFNSIKTDYNLGDLKLISNKIKLGYDSKQNGEPYMLFDTSIGENGFETWNTMKLTTTRLSFISKQLSSTTTTCFLSLLLKSLFKLNITLFISHYSLSFSITLVL